MQHIIKIITIITILVFAISCKNKIENKDVITPIEENTEIKQPDKHQHEASAVQLNDGKKWEANIETTEGIKKMQQIMASFSKKESPSAYTSLKESLEFEFTAIFEKCTMKGESHNQLHNYLKPMLGLFDGLESTNLDTCKESYQTMNKHLSHYNNYFE